MILSNKIVGSCNIDYSKDSFLAIKFVAVSLMLRVKALFNQLTVTIIFRNNDK